MIAEVIQAGLADSDDCGVRSGQLPDLREIGVLGFRDLVGMDAGCRPECRMTPRQLRGDSGILEIRSNRDHPGDARIQRRIENGRPIFVEAVIREMAVTVEHDVRKLLTLDGRLCPEPFAPLAARRIIAEPLLDLKQGRRSHGNGRIGPDRDAQDQHQGEVADHPTTDD